MCHTYMVPYELTVHVKMHEQRIKADSMLPNQSDRICQKINGHLFYKEKV
jgi:hypothetical protein